MKMRKEEGDSGMYQTNCIHSICTVALMLALAACEKAREPTKAAIQLKATKIGEVSDLVTLLSCEKRDGQKDQGIRLQIPPEKGAQVSYMELRASGTTGVWDSCSAPVTGTWKLQVAEEGADEPMGPHLDLSKGGVFVLHYTDNETVATQATFELKGMDKDGQEIFRVTVSD